LFPSKLRICCIIRVPVLLIPLCPAALASQSILTISPQQCIWRAGDNTAWAALNLDESGWQPYQGFSLSGGDTIFWVRCHVEANLSALPHPAVQVLGADLRVGSFSMALIPSVCSSIEETS
jgi:hypothetical protein